MYFKELTLNPGLQRAIAERGYTEMTAVQEKTLAKTLQGLDVAVQSQTGTGKTAAFGIGIIERIAAQKSKKALILTPTRELAVQVCKELRGIGQMHKLRIHVVYGGQSINVQLDEIRPGVDILIATPGRLIDLSERGAVKIGEFDISILDEADQMLDMGFQDEVFSILDQLPQKRQTLMLSATLDESILGIAAKYIPHPKTIELGEIVPASTIKEEHIETTDLTKFPRLLEVLREHEGMKILVFRETKIGASRLQERLWHRGVKAGVLQGDMTQAQRNKTLEDFKEGGVKILVATNVAARGLHVENLGLIVNYDRAQSEEIHLHRIGRTGRMGHEGKAINFVLRKETLDERMSENHPDFAWMKGSGIEMYRGERRREGPHGGHHDRPGTCGRPYGPGAHGGRPRQTGEHGATPHNTAGGERPQQHGHGTGTRAHGTGSRGYGSDRRRKPRY